VGNPVKKPIIGILGGICSGKTTVAAEFGKLGCGIVDADKITHEILEQDDVKKKIVAAFGEGILNSARNIDHRKLAEVVFSSGRMLSKLNSIAHPLVLSRAEALIEQYNLEPEVKAIVLDIPLLVEVGWHKRCQKLVFVNCKRHLRVDRAKKTGGFDENQLKIRENFQFSIDKKAAIVDNTIDNNSDLSALARQVAEAFSCIINNA
jgi:dephospho-CoA kinase